jgi:hypothetical protein
MPIASVPLGREQHLAERLRRQRDEALGKLDCGRVREPARGERQCVERALDGGDDMRMPVADLVHVVAMEVHEAPAFDVGQPDAVGFDQRVEAGRRQRLVHERRAVALEPRARQRADVLLLVALASRRKIDVAFGRRIDQRAWRSQGVHLTRAANTS